MKDRTGVNNWGFFMTVDAERGLLYTTFGSPASDYYGFDRKGNDRMAIRWLRWTQTRAR